MGRVNTAMNLAINTDFIGILLAYSPYNTGQRFLINPRKLAAIDIVLLGSKVIIAEFASGVLLCVALGAFVLLRGSSFWQLGLGLYLTSLGISYVPMLIYALAVTRRDGARAELGDELNDKRRALAKYRRQSLWLLVPLLVPLLALGEERRKTSARGGD